MVIPERLLEFRSKFAYLENLSFATKCPFNDKKKVWSLLNYTSMSLILVINAFQSTEMVLNKGSVHGHI